MKTHTGKIARLPRNIRDELNRRLDQGETAGKILPWLNALPEAQSVLAADFGGGQIKAQNLSNWRQGGYQDWQKQQERRHLVRELAANAQELAADAGEVEVANHLSAVLAAEFADSARRALGAMTDPAERCVREQEFLLTLARVRRQDYLAGRLAIDRERRARERAKETEADQQQREWAKEWAPIGRQFKRSAMTDSYAKPDFSSQLLATQNAESLLRDVKLDPPGPAGSVRRENRPSR